MLLRNDDIAPDISYFLEVEKIFSRQDISGIVFGSKIFAGTTGKIWSIGGYFSKWGKYGMYRDPGANPSSFFYCAWLPGMGTIVPASAISTKGLYWDEKQFPQYPGDSDFSLCFKKKGYQLKTSLTLFLFNPPHIS